MEPTFISSPVGAIMALAGIASFFFWLEKKTSWKIFKFFPPLIFIYTLPVVFSNTGLIPHKSAAYTFMGDNLLPMFLTIMLLNIDLKATVRVMGKGIFVMLLGTLGVVVGAPIAIFIVKSGLSPEAWKGFGALAGSWIGGTGNMFATAQMVGLSDDSIQYGYALIADNVVYLIWLPLMLASKSMSGWFARFTGVDSDRLAKMEAAAKDLTIDKGKIEMRHILYLVFFGFAVTTFSSWLSPLIPTVKTTDEITVISQQNNFDQDQLFSTIQVAEDINVVGVDLKSSVVGEQTDLQLTIKTDDNRRIIFDLLLENIPSEIDIASLTADYTTTPSGQGSVVVTALALTDDVVVVSSRASPGVTTIISAKTYKILLVTILGILLSFTAARNIPGSHPFSMALVYLFVAQMGAKADLSDLSVEVLWFLLGAYIWIFIHGAFLLGAAWLFKVDVHTAAIASAANIGGAASAPIVAAHHNRALVPVSILMAMIGYAIGNPAAFVAAMLCRWVM